MIEEQFRGMSEAYSAQGRGPDQNLTKIVALSQEPTSFDSTADFRITTVGDPTFSSEDFAD